MQKLKVLFVALFVGLFTALQGGLAHADGISDMFALVDLAPVQVGVLAVLAAVIGLKLIFVGYSYVNKALPGKK